MPLNATAQEKTEVPGMTFSPKREIDCDQHNPMEPSLPITTHEGFRIVRRVIDKTLQDRWNRQPACNHPPPLPQPLHPPIPLPCLCTLPEKTRCRLSRR